MYVCVLLLLFLCTLARWKPYSLCFAVLVIVYWALICHCHVTLTIITFSSAPPFYLLLLVFVVVLTLLSPSLWCGAPALKRPSVRPTKIIFTLLHTQSCWFLACLPILWVRAGDVGVYGMVAIFSARNLTIRCLSKCAACELILLRLLLATVGFIVELYAAFLVFIAIYCAMS